MNDFPTSSGYYRLFASAQLGRLRPSPLEGFEESYVTWSALFSDRLPLTLRHWIGRWRLVCSVFLHPMMPTVYTVWSGGKLVHFSFVLPNVSRLPGMGLGDYEIGPCWTDPAYRRRGLFGQAIRRIQHDLGAPDRVFWMVVRHENEISAAGILKSGFTEIGPRNRVRHAFLPIHIYAQAHVQGRLARRLSRAQRDLLVEQERYNVRAREKAAAFAALASGLVGAEAIRPSLREPYTVYHDMIRAWVRPGMRTLELCSGDGQHSLTAPLAGAEACAVDVAEASLDLARTRAAAHGVQLRTVCANVETLPFETASLDLVTCAGGLSYVEREPLLAEVRRVLKPGGGFLFVDSFDHNWIYRANRLLHCLRAERTFSTLRRMPDAHLLVRLREMFGQVEVRHFGNCAFLVPLLVPILGERRTARFLTASDRATASMPKLAFKVVVLARNLPPA